MYKLYSKAVKNSFAQKNKVNLKIVLEFSYRFLVPAEQILNQR